MQEKPNPSDGLFEDDREIRFLYARAEHICRMWWMSATEVQEFAQQGMTELFIYLKNGNDAANRPAVLKKILCSLLWKTKRKQRPLCELPPELQAIALGPDEWVARDEECKSLCLAAHLLTPDEKRVLEPISDSFSYPELAEMDGRSLSSVYRERDEVLDKLKVYLQDLRRAPFELWAKDGLKSLKEFAIQRGFLGYRPLILSTVDSDSVVIYLRSSEGKPERKILATTVLRPFHDLRSELSWHFAETQQTNFPQIGGHIRPMTMINRDCPVY